MNLRNIPVVILAGGMGTRLSSIIDDRPKVMAEIRGKPFLNYILDWLKGKGLRDIYISVGFMKNKIISYYQNGETFGLNIKYIKENIPLGTGGAVIKAIKYIESEFILILNGDSFLDLNLNDFVSDHLKKNACMTIACIKKEKTDRYGCVTFNTENKIIGFTEKGDSDQFWINGGIYLLTKSKFNFISEKFPISLEKDIMPNIIHKNIVNAFTQEGINFIDIGTPNSLEYAQSFMLEVK